MNLMDSCRGYVTTVTKTDTVLGCSLGVSLALLLYGFYIDVIWLGLLLPTTLMVMFLCIFKPSLLFVLLFAAIPLTSEIALSSGLSTDVPGEPLLWVLTVMTIIFMLVYPLPKGLIIPIGLIIGIQLLWLIVTSLQAEHMTLSFKYTLAKVWYILPFYVLPFYLFKSVNSIHYLLDVYLFGLLVAASYFFVRHALIDFDFLAKTTVGNPIWRNHVNYACSLILSMPIVLYRRQRSPNRYRWMYSGLAILLLVFMYYSYARVVYICMGAWIAYVICLRLCLTRYAILIVIILLTCLTYFQLRDYNYVRMAPTFEEAIMHDSFNNKIAATLNGRDISTMERLHRWVAGIDMVADNPIFGVGPSNFYSTYKRYAIHSFETYVSDNPERSGIHNYFLMTIVEQGVSGLLLLVSLLVVALLRVEKLYHQTHLPALKSLLMMAGASLVIIITMNTINDLLEVIKVGGLFFFSLYLIAAAPYLLDPHDSTLPA